MVKKDNPDIIILSNGKKFNKRSWLMSTLRRASYRWAPRNESLKLARKDRGLYQCAYCEGLFRNKEYIIDHVEPVIPLSGPPMHPITKGLDWTIIIERLFCDISNFQILCIKCSDIKTSLEDSCRVKKKKKRRHGN